jgi:anti-sigma regulatory factor (Ser/Thr protein kinase)/serine/threonine protein phosphatase PrpC
VEVSRPLGGPAAGVYVVEDTSQVGEVRRTAASLAGEVGLNETQRGKLALVVTEVATNLARHARRGRILLSEVGDPPSGVEVLALDEGPGIPNVARAMEDGFSSAGTAGKGLGAVRRMADEFDLYSRPGDGAGAGTVLFARVWSSAGGAPPAGPGGRLQAGVACVALRGERVCGDAWVVLPQRDRTLVAVVDGLGHGPEAAVAASEAVRVIRESADASPSQLLQLSHAALRPTRGAAMAVAAIQPGRRAVAFAGVGNVAAAVHVGTTARSLASHNGTVGHATRTIQEFSYDWAEGATLVMHSDGINSRWRLDAYPGIVRYHPVVLAAVLFRDAARGRDDATVLVVRDRFS